MEFCQSEKVGTLLIHLLEVDSYNLLIFLCAFLRGLHSNFAIFSLFLFSIIAVPFYL